MHLRHPRRNADFVRSLEDGRKIGFFFARHEQGSTRRLHKESRQVMDGVGSAFNKLPPGR
jgi:hypothetical protein